MLGFWGAGTRLKERLSDRPILLVRIHFIVERIRWTSLAPWEFEFSLSGSLASTFLAGTEHPAEGKVPSLPVGIGTWVPSP